MLTHYSAVPESIIRSFKEMLIGTSVSLEFEPRVFQCRHAAPDTARAHINALLRAAVNVAILDAANREAQCLISPLMGQLLHLSAALISATPDRLRFDLCQQLLRVRQP